MLQNKILTPYWKILIKNSMLLNNLTEQSLFCLKKYRYNNRDAAYRTCYIKIFQKELYKSKKTRQKNTSGRRGVFICKSVERKFFTLTEKKNSRYHVVLYDTYYVLYTNSPYWPAARW